MHTYLVTFHKVVSDDTGHERRVRQRASVIRARSDVAALYEAKAIFCASAGIVDWRLRADSCEIVALPEQAA